MLTIGQTQELYFLTLAKFVLKANELGYTMRQGQAERTPEQQEIFIKTGASKTRNSTHLLRLAQDIYAFKDGVYLNGDTPSERAELLKLGLLWEQLCDEAGLSHEWGGRFGTDDPSVNMGWDSNHYGVKYGARADRGGDKSPDSKGTIA